MAKALRIVIAVVTALMLLGSTPLPMANTVVDFETSGPEPPVGG